MAAGRVGIMERQERETINSRVRDHVKFQNIEF
jgi:hypothetical protein